MNTILERRECPRDYMAEQPARPGGPGSKPGRAQARKLSFGLVDSCPAVSLDRHFVTNARRDYIPKEDEVPGSSPGGSNRWGHRSRAKIDVAL